MDQSVFTDLFCARPQNFGWFLGAGVSRSAGLPTATDILWDLKRKYYCREENQEITRQDTQNDAVREKIQAFMESKGFPALWSEDEYPAYFKRIFGDDKERQRKYLRAVLSEENVTLAIGHRVLGALVSSKLSRVAFTTNFDSVLEKAVAEVSGSSLMAFHLEGPRAANEALNNEDFPLYCKLHGDFRFDSLKNLPNDLATQDAEFAQCLKNAANRFGFIVCGYSGRDKSILELFQAVLSTANPFPHGLFWTGIKGEPLLDSVQDLLEQARSYGIQAEHVPIETFDALLLRLWRNLPNKLRLYDEKVRRTRISHASIPLPSTGTGPIVRMNALPVLSVPQQCIKLSLTTPVDWDDLREIRHESESRLILTKGDELWCWGNPSEAQEILGKRLRSIDSVKLPPRLGFPDQLHVKGFLEEAICAALARSKPLLCRTTKLGSTLIADRHAEDHSSLKPIHDVLGRPFGEIAGLFSPITEDYPNPERVFWAESVRISLDTKGDRTWLLIDPDIWIWPPRARRVATDFLDKRRSDRRNDRYNDILNAWLHVILGTAERNTHAVVAAFDGEEGPENPSFRISTRTAYSRRLN